MRCIIFAIISIIIQTASLENNACYTVSDYSSASSSANCYHNSNFFSPISKVITKNGFRSKKYLVTTSDGYILELYRIFSNKTKVSTTQVFILHGMIVTSSSWVDTDNQSLAFYIAGRGYDVWLGNVRGSMYSNKHKTLSVNDPEYWHFSLDTLTAEDLTVQLNFVASLTKERIIIIGHSMGSTLSFMYSSEYSEQAKQLLKGIIAMGPVAYINDSPLANFFMPFGTPLIEILSDLKITGLAYQENFFHHLLIDTCKSLPNLCYFLLSTLPGRTKLIPPEEMLIMFNSWPSGISIYVLKHYLQIAQSKRFQKYDFGREKNKNLYGTSRPPVYDLSKIQVPVALFYGENDFVFNDKNLERLYDEIGSNKKSKLSVPRNSSANHFNHINFLYAKNITEYLYTDLLNVLISMDSEK